MISFFFYIIIIGVHGLLFLGAITIAFRLFGASENNGKTYSSDFYTDNYNEARAARKGRVGEYIVARQLSRLKREYCVINDVMILSGYRTSQIDHIVVSQYGIFVIETKNYSGALFGNEYDNYVAHVCKDMQYMIYNPMKQNRIHVRALMQELEISAKSVFVPILAVSNYCDCNISASNMEAVPFSCVRNAIRSHKQKVLTKQQVKEITQRIQELNITNAEERRRHVERAKLVSELPF